MLLVGRRGSEYELVRKQWLGFFHGRKTASQKHSHENPCHLRGARGEREGTPHGEVSSKAGPLHRLCRQADRPASGHKRQSQLSLSVQTHNSVLTGHALLFLPSLLVRAGGFCADRFGLLGGRRESVRSRSRPGAQGGGGNDFYLHTHAEWADGSARE